MAHLSVGTMIEANQISSNTAFIEMLDIQVLNADGTHREWIYICKNNENFEFDGKLYLAADFEADVKQKTGSVPEITLSARDPIGLVRSRMDEFNGGEDFAIFYSVVNTGNVEQGFEHRFEFKCTGASEGSNYTVMFKLGVENPLSKSYPSRAQFNKTCSHIFKDGRCGYTGELATCDYTFAGANGCIAHGNARNFGGFIGLMDLY